MEYTMFSSNGRAVSFDEVIYYMDAELLKQALIAFPFEAQEFYNEYCKLHLEKFGEPFSFEVEEDDEE